jgi:hypothetical protein
LISLHNYFIIHDIKYFFLNKINQTIQWGQKKFSGGANYRKYYRKTLFFKIQGGSCPPPSRASVHPLLDRAAQQSRTSTQGWTCRTFPHQHRCWPKMTPLKPSCLVFAWTRANNPSCLCAISCAPRCLDPLGNLSFSLFSAVWALCGAEPGASVVAPCFWCGLPAKPCSTFWWLLYMLLLPCWPDFGYLTYK